MKIRIYSFIKEKFRLVIFSVLILSSLPFLGADCGKLVNGEENSVANLLYSWVLYRQTGSLIDVCLNERLTFNTDRTATSVCPGADTVRSNFSVLNGVLTFESTGYTYQYAVDSLSTGRQLTLTGQNVSRNLYYKIATTENITNEINTGLIKKALKPVKHLFGISKNEEEIK
jgi:hypothetical protein